MTIGNGKVPVLSGAIDLGARKLILHLSRDLHEILSIMAASTEPKRTPIQLAEQLLVDNITTAWRRYLMTKVMWELTRWVVWK